MSLNSNSLKPFTGFSFIIPHRESEDISATLSGIKQSFQQLAQRNPKFAKINYEIITTTGNHPSLQRNEAAKQAKYSHLYFLDNDSFVSTHSLKISSELLQKQTAEKPIKVLGGPAILPPKSNFWQKNIAATLSSKAVIGQMADRYFYFEKKESAKNNPTANLLKSCDDSSLILCNLIVEKNCFNENKGFNLKLYPNEENEFLYRLQEQKIILYYHPEIIIYRQHRENLQDYIRQMSTYGRGRGEQTRINPQSSSLIHLLAMGFPLFVLFSVLGWLAPFLLNFFSLKNWASINISGENIWQLLKIFLSYFWIFYFLGYLFLFLKSSKRYQKILILAPFLTFCCHFFYGWGIWKGLFQKTYNVEKKKTTFKIKKQK